MATAQQHATDRACSKSGFWKAAIPPAAGHERAIQWVSLLWSAFFFIQPYYKHSVRVWLGFALFYAVFLTLYWAVVVLRNRWSQRATALLFVLAFVYFPLNHSAGGLFVYPAVLLAFVTREPRAGRAAAKFATILGAEILGVFLEVYLLKLPMDWAENITFYIVVLGVSNFAYARQLMASDQLKLAHQEIERLAQTAERERIARDLHDLLGHTLTVIAIKADLANRVFSLDPAMAQREISDVEQTARRALAEVREAVAGYRGEGLPSEIAQARRTLAAAGVQLTTNVEPLPLPQDVLNTLCLALREAVTNVVRHARATMCVLELKGTDTGVRLCLEDNGSGGAVVEGSGLRGMRERVSQLGGRMTTEQREGGGLRLIVELTRDVVPPASREITTSGLSTDLAWSRAEEPQTQTAAHLPGVARA